MEKTMDSSADQCKSPPIEEKTDKLKIVLDSPENTYHSGQKIQGTVYLKHSEIRGIYFHVIGKSKCNWTEWLTTDSKPADGKKRTSDYRFWGKEDHLNPIVYIVGSKNAAYFAPEKSYKFSFELKTDLPSTFRSDNGKIKYKMKFVVDKRWRCDKQTIVLNIIRTVNLNLIEGTLLPFENQLTKTYGFVDSGPISLHVSVPKRGFVLGDKIPIKATITNSSKMDVEKLKYYLHQIVEYHSIVPHERIKMIENRLLKKDEEGVRKKSEHKYELVIDVPENIPPNQEKTVSRLIHIKYELRVEAKIGGLHKNLVISCPITIGTISHMTNERHSVILRYPEMPQSPNNSDANISQMISHWSLHLDSPQNQSNRSTIQSTIYPISPIDFMSNPSIGSNLNGFPMPQSNQFSINGYPPTAPPIDFNMRSSIQPNSQFVPPSYDEAVRSSYPGQMNLATSSPSQNIPNKS